MAKTPAYTLKAIKSYQEQIVQKKVNLHKTKDAKLIEHIEQDTEQFTPLVKSLLRKHYGVDNG